jgi:hypothetical protein
MLRRLYGHITTLTLHTNATSQTFFALNRVGAAGQGSSPTEEMFSWQE